MLSKIRLMIVALMVFSVVESKEAIEESWDLSRSISNKIYRISDENLRKMYREAIITPETVPDPDTSGEFDEYLQGPVGIPAGTIPDRDTSELFNEYMQEAKEADRIKKMNEDHEYDPGPQKSSFEFYKEENGDLIKTVPAGTLPDKDASELYKEYVEAAKNEELAKESNENLAKMDEDGFPADESEFWRVLTTSMERIRVFPQPTEPEETFEEITPHSRKLLYPE